MSKYVVRFGTMRSLGVMATRHEASYRRGDEVIVRSDRGLEVGLVLCEAADDALTHLDQPTTGQIVRAVSDDDANEINHIDGSREKKLEVCQKHIEALKLDMKLIDVEQLFGGERLVVYYISSERVDFRELVKKLAGEFQTRIEMRQIGVRDEAKLLADYGDCGKPVCCNNHLVTMPPVSMKMAKLQKATLDPTKISGRCGRLKCCLRYEFDTYEEIHKQLPKVGWQIVTRDGKARVLNQQILAEQLLIETEDHRRMVIDASEVLSVINRSSPPKSSKNRYSDGKKRQNENESETKSSTKTADSPSPAKKKTNTDSVDTKGDGQRKDDNSSGSRSAESTGKPNPAKPANSKSGSQTSRRNRNRRKDGKK